MSLFRLVDLKRFGGTGKTVSALHKSLFPGAGTASDREKIYLMSKGAVTGTLQDRWRKLLGTPPGTRLGESIRKLAALP
jgi:hypothetical protein